MKKNLRSIFNKFIKKAGIKARDGKQVYICEEFHQKISLMANLDCRGEITIADYLHNVLEDHFRMHGTTFNEVLNEALKARL